MTLKELAHLAKQTLHTRAGSPVKRSHAHELLAAASVATICPLSFRLARLDVAAASHRILHAGQLMAPEFTKYAGDVDVGNDDLLPIRVLGDSHFQIDGRDRRASQVVAQVPRDLRCSRLNLFQRSGQFETHDLGDRPVLEAGPQVLLDLPVALQDRCWPKVRTRRGIPVGTHRAEAAPPSVCPDPVGFGKSCSEAIQFCNGLSDMAVEDPARMLRRISAPLCSTPATSQAHGDPPCSTNGP